jgi:cell division protein FtsI (penicillin-binding protein 3)
MRYVIISMAILFMAVVILLNLFKNTIVDAPKWNARVMRELSDSVTAIPPERGDILASDGSVLATTMQFYTLRIDFGSEGFQWRGYVNNIDSLADSLHRYFPIPGGLVAWQDSLRAPFKRNKRPRGWRLIKNVSYADYQRIRQFPFFKGRRLGEHGMLAEPSKRRRNPYGSMAKLSIGVVSENRRTGEVHGMSGLEYALDSLLYGVPGVAKRVNFNRGIGKWAEVPAVRGWDVVSTIDVQMQDILENALLDRLEFTRAEWGTAVLMEVATGEIKAISNLEEYPLGSGSGHYVEAMNRAVRGFEPGSVVKTLSMMIALEDGIVSDLDSVITIGASYRAYGQGSPITDSHFNSQLTVAGIIEQSSNIGMARIITSRYRDPQKWHDRVASLGFLQKLGSGIGEETAARYPVYPIKAGGLVTLSRQSYGYATEIPPLHTLSIYNAIANGGRYVRPRLIKGLHRDGIDSVIPVSYIRDRICSETNAKKMQQMLSLVVNGSRGTARSLKNDYVTLAGKTGTCYSVDPNTRKYDKARKRLAFCGYFPAESPKYSCIVLIYHPRQEAFGAASTSGVVLKNVAMNMYSRAMLGNSSDYHDGADTIHLAPITYASTSTDAAKVMQQQFGVSARRMVKRASTSTAPGHVPDVVGMGLREAVATIESKKYNVRFTGQGYVRSQQPAAGTPLRAGSKVSLILSE